jgi:hypothetical protein
VNAATNEQLAAYGTFLGERYRDAPNIIWSGGGDRGDNLTATDEARTDAMMTAIRAAAPQLMTGHTDDLNTADDLWGEYGWLDLNNSYQAQRDPLSEARNAYADTPTRPTFYIEGQYEQDPQRSPVLTNGARMLRIQMWAPQLAGSVGHVFGNDPRWYFGATWGGPYGAGTWQESLSHPAGNRDAGTDHLQVFAQFWRDPGDLAWWQLVPDTTDTFLTAGEGTGETQAAAAFDATTGYAVVYAPSNVSVTLDLTELDAAAQVRVHRYDPTAGGYVTVGTYPTTGPQTITHPGANVWGDSDWVYLLEPLDVQTWTGSAGAVTVAGTSGSFTAGPVTWAGSTGAVSIAGQSGSFTTGGTASWTGSSGAVHAAGVSGSFTAGTVTWAGSTGAVRVSGVSGPFVGGAATWTGGSTGAVAVAGTSGSFTGGPPPQTWTGSSGAVHAAGVSGAFTPAGTPWAGSSGAVHVSGVSGSFTGGGTTWTGSTGSVSVAGQSGAFSSGGAVWSGSTGSVYVAGQSGSFTEPGPVVPGAVFRWTGVAWVDHDLGPDVGATVVAVRTWNGTEWVP